MTRSTTLSHAKTQITISLFERRRGRPSKLSIFLRAQRDLFPTELAIACYAPHLVRGLPPVVEQVPADKREAAQAAPAGGGDRLGNSIRICGTRKNPEGQSA